MSVAHPESPLEICYRLLIRMCAVAWNDLEVQVATFLVRHFASHKSTEHFLDGCLRSRHRACIIHKASLYKLPYISRFTNRVAILSPPH
jgi:hypothetical protein